MRLFWSSVALQDYNYWRDTNPKLHIRINKLIAEIERQPFKGLGKPEPLKGDFAGCWSRRIDSEHRLVYRIEGKGKDQRLEIIQCRFHY